MLLIRVPKPCHEDWNKMLPSEKGAFCNVCSKTVVDFTTLNDEEVKNYFLTNQGQKTCGRFKNTQLTNSDNPLQAVLAGNIPLWKKFLAIVIILFGSLLTGCKEEVVGKIALPGKEAREIEAIVGATVIERSCNMEMGEPKVEELMITKGLMEAIIVTDAPIIQGDIIIEAILPDTSLNTKPELQKIDSAKKLVPVKNDCDSTKTGSANSIYYEP